MIRKILAFIGLIILIILAKGGVLHATPFIQDTQSVDSIKLFIPKPKPEEPSDPPKVVTEADNPQHCTDNQWIASESPFYCIEKSYQDSSSNQIFLESHSNYSSSGNTYTPGQCTWGVKEWRPSIPNGLGNAYSWISSAQALGMATGSVPKVGAVGVVGNHVVLVVGISGGTITIREMNYDYVPFHERYKEAQASEYYYIY